MTLDGATQVPGRAPAGGRGWITATLRDRIAEVLRERILTGELPPGAKLSLDDLAEEFGSSRTPVREALIELSHDRLVELAPRRGVHVIGITSSGLRDSFDTFGALAGVAAEWATEHASDDLIARLRQLNDIVAGAEQDAVSIDANWEFHTLLNKACGSPRLLSTMKQLGRTIPAGFIKVVPEQADVSVKEHHAIIEAVARRDPLGARTAAEHHVRDAGARMVRTLEQQGILAD
jgi:DNA-binding GntR family transcriptional regulator